MSDLTKFQAINTLSLLGYLSGDIERSELYAELYPDLHGRIEAIYEELVKASGIPSEPADTLKQRAFNFYAAAVESEGNGPHAASTVARGNLLNAMNKALTETSQLSKNHPQKATDEQGIDVTRSEIIRTLFDAQPYWLNHYRQTPAGRLRHEQIAIADALGGHAIVKTPCERLLITTGEAIDALESLGTKSALLKAERLTQGYSGLSERYLFDPAKVSITQRIEETPDGPVTHSSIGIWVEENQKQFMITKSSKPSEPAPSRTALVDYAAGQVSSKIEPESSYSNEVANFAKSVLNHVQPEASQPSFAQRQLEMCSCRLEVGLSDNAPEAFKDWKARGVVGMDYVTVPATNLIELRREYDLSSDVGNKGYLQAVTPEDKQEQAHMMYFPLESLAVITRYASRDALEYALSKDAPNQQLTAGDPNLESSSDPTVILTRALESAMPYLDQEQASMLAKLLRGELSPEAVEATEEWLDSLYSTPSGHEMLMNALNEVSGCHGIEQLSTSAKEEYEDTFEYLNVGNSDSTTIIYFEGQYYLSGIADFKCALEQLAEDNQEGRVREGTDASFANPYPMPRPLTDMITAAEVEQSNNFKASPSFSY